MSRKILIVEDDEVNSIMLSEYLEQNNITTTIIHQDDDVLDACYNTSPDIVIMNLDIYGVEGVDACIKIQSDESFRKLPIFAITALPHEKFNEEYHGDIFDEYIEKPIILSDLLDTINKYLG